MSDGDFIHASEETDACVAREVFGFEVREMWLWVPEDSESPRRFEENPPANDFDKAFYTAQKMWCFNDPGIGWKPVPRYSIQHLDAMMVVEYLRRRRYRIVLEGDISEWFCKILFPATHAIIGSGLDKAIENKEPSFPLAVCRAALRCAHIVRRMP